MKVWHIRSWLALLLVGAAATLWAQPPPTLNLAPPMAPPPARAETTMPVPPAVGQIPAPSPAMQPRPTPLALAQLESLAQTYNPILRRDTARIEWARGNALQAGLYPNPRFDPGNPQVFAGRDSLFSFGFQQELVVNGKLRLDTAAANELTRQAEITYQQNRFALLTSVRQQYFVVLAAQRRLQVLTELAGITRQAAETSRKLEKAQEVSRIDTLLLLNEFQHIQAKLGRAQALVVGQRRQLAAIVGVGEVQAAELAGDLSARRPTFEEEFVRQYAMTSSTLVQYAHAEITRNEILLERAKAEPCPNPTVGPAYQFGARPDNEQFCFNLTFPVPLWDRNQGNIRAAQANVQAAQQTLRTVQNDQLQQVADALSRYQAAWQLVERYERDILPNVRETLRLSQKGLEGGVFDFARYLQSQRAVTEANLDYLDALEDLWTNAAKIAGLLQLERLP